MDPRQNPTNNSKLQAGEVRQSVEQDSDDGRVPPSYFEKKYTNSHDPWNFEKSEYEAQKYQKTLASLPRDRYKSALEVGCSIGVFTKQLAMRCGRLLSVDVSEIALLRARERCALLSQVEFARVRVPQEAPIGVFDLIMISEVAYYWPLKDLDRAATIFAARQPVGGHLVLVHFTELVSEHPLTGDQVHDAWVARPEWQLLKHVRADRYRLDVLERRN